MPLQTTSWWKDGTAYQIWPASYKDSNGDGMGDILGIISTLDYLKDLGVDIIWLSPMYDSPQADMGYDISNYEDVYAGFGTLNDMILLIKEMHARGMKLILDLVINHTSDEHPWFKESCKSTSNDKSDWYIWKKPRYIDGKRCPPTNWLSIFGGSVWEYVEARDEYYLHLFTIQQPDLNWESAEARKAIYQTAIEFWLSHGVDGFRVDAVNLYCKDSSFADAEISLPGRLYQPAIKHYINGPRMHEWLKEMRVDAIEKYGDVMLVGELPETDTKAEILSYVSAAAKELDMVFDFDIFKTGGWGATVKHEISKFSLANFKKGFAKTQNLLVDTDAWTTVFLENHDLPRSITRFASEIEAYRSSSGKLLATLVTSMSGSLYIYQGQEIGMINIPPTWGIEDYKDVDTVKYFKDIQARFPGDDEMLSAAIYGYNRLGRDSARTPIQWDGSENAGFTTGHPWMRVNDNFKEINVAAQLHDPNSVLEFWKRALKIRKEYAGVLIQGSFKLYEPENESTFTFMKQGVDGKQILVVLNFSNEEVQPVIPSEIKGRKMELLLTNGEEEERLAPWGARMFLIK